MAFNRKAAVEYARKWALSTNPKYLRFDNDCTSFVSQAMLAGGWSMVGERSFSERKKDTAWWYGGAWFTRASYTWGGAHNFSKFLKVSKRGVQVHRTTSLGLGDVVQIMNGSKHVYHTMIVTKKTSDDLLLSYHTTDHLDEPLSAIRSRLSSGHQFIYWRISDSKC